MQQEELDRIMKEALCIQCGCCVSECNSMAADPDFLGPAALAKGAKFVGDVRDRDRKGRLELYNGPHGVWDCTRCYFCNERCPKGVDPRDAIAKIGAEIYSEGMLSTRARATPRCSTSRRRTTGYLLETALMPVHRPAEGDGREVRPCRWRKAGKVPIRCEPHRAKKLDEVRKLHKLLKTQEAERDDRSSAGVSVDREEAGVVKSQLRVLPGLPGEPVPEGARHLDPGDLREARDELIDIPGFTCCGAGDVHEARPEYYLHLNARILGQAEQLGQDTLLTICNVCTLNLRQADIKLKADPELLERVNRNLRDVGAAPTRAASRCGTCCGRSPRARATSG